MNYGGSKWLICTVLLSVPMLTLVSAQRSVSKAAVENVSGALNDFSLEILENLARRKNNVAISGYTIWCVLSMIADGAFGNTAKELRNVLKTQNIKQNDFWDGYRFIANSVANTDSSVRLDITNAIFVDKDIQLRDMYRQTVERNYNASIFTEEFKNLMVSLRNINGFISTATKNRINNFIRADELTFAKMLITSILYFKGSWKTPFNHSATQQEAFLDENDNFLGQVPMMYQLGPFLYTRLPSLNAFAVELPYGDANEPKMSMIAVLPKKGTSLDSVLQLLKQSKMNVIFDALQKAEAYDDDVHVYLPRFSITSDYTLNAVLTAMGINEIFQVYADLRGISPNSVFLNYLIHRSNIEVNEEGTIASAAAGGTFQYKSPPPSFKANRPFAYFIIDKTTKAVLLSGAFNGPQ